MANVKASHWHTEQNWGKKPIQCPTCGTEQVVKHGRTKNGQLVAGAAPENAIHLTRLDKDMGEQRNLRDEHPDLTNELACNIESSYEGIANQTLGDFSVNEHGTTGRKSVKIARSYPIST